jgi:protein-glutamine gamma-glutamyltransferase
VAGWLPSPLTSVLSQVFEKIATALAWLLGGLTALFSQGWLGLLVGIGLITSMAFLGWLGWSGWQVWRYRRWLAKLPPMEAIYQQMLQNLAQQGFGKQAAQTPLECATDCRARYSNERAKAIDEISRAYVQWRYGGKTADLNSLQELLKRLQGSRRSKGRKIR